MKNKYIVLIAFLAVAAAQLYVPASMVLDREEILENGKTFRFRTAPVDPNDPFRGKYIILGFTDNSFNMPGETDTSYDQDVYVRLAEDEAGFAVINQLSFETLPPNGDFVKAKLSSWNVNDDTTTFFVQYPFDRFYLEEYKAPKAEELYIESQRDSLKTTWAVVKIKDGNAVLEDVMIDGVSVIELVRNKQSD